jgi:hypothetical protein
VKFPREQLSERTRRAVQDFTALNTIASAFESCESGERDSFALDLLATLVAAEDAKDLPRLRIPLSCALGRRLVALGVVAYPVGGSRGVVRHSSRRGGKRA